VSKLAELYPAVVVTDGPQAVWCAEASKVSTIPVPDPVASSDPTGAGDAFNAGVLAGLAQGAELPEALESGLALARRCVIKAGARP
jgi:sugar/nucleoside kinase (ribokinase family)